MPEGFWNVSSCNIWSGIGSCFCGISYITSSVWLGRQRGEKVAWGSVDILGTEAEGSTPGSDALLA